MGYGMATNVRKKISKDATMFINDINAKACDRFVQEVGQYGPIEIMPTAKEAASKSQILISIVPASKHVRQVYLDSENGVLAASKDDKRLILECSTIDADTTREVGGAIMQAGLGRYVDAPVSVGLLVIELETELLTRLLGWYQGGSSWTHRFYDRMSPR